METNVIKAIETQYKGYLFRSRLEARWAVFFDALGLVWEYEPDGFDLGVFGWYLPDFWLPGLDCYAEVKPKKFTEKEWNKCNALSHPCLLLDGIPDHRAWAVTDSGDYIWYSSGLPYRRVCLDMSAYKGRIWYLFGELITNYDAPVFAIYAARSARFEYGENPYA